MIARLTAAALILLGLIAYGKSHSFYALECCSGQDCEPIDERRVEAVTGGFLLDGRFFVKEQDARFAPDGNYHACFWPNPDTLRCFYRPAMGS